MSTKKSFYKRVWFWLVLSVFALFAGCSAVVAGGSAAINKANNVKHTVVYTVTGNGTADITYSTFDNGNSGTAQVTGATLPWTKTITSTGIFAGYDVSGSVDTGSSVTCSITVDGKNTAQQTSTGQYASADCTS